MREYTASNGQQTHTGGDVPAWTAYDAYTVRREGPLRFPPRQRADGVELALGVLGVFLFTGAVWGWIWGVQAVLLPMLRAFGGR